MKKENEFSSASKIPPPPDGAVRRAVIDVGTNSVKLLVADLVKNEVQPVWEGSEQTRLGRGFYETHRLQAESINLTAEAIAHFAETAKTYGAISIRVIATSAARDAKNAADLINAITNAADLPLEVISGEQEAELAFQGVCTNPNLAKSSLLLLDVGGGSTEFIVGAKSHLEFRESFQLGTVRLLEQLPHSDPPSPDQLEACRVWLRHFLEDRVAPKLRPVLSSKSALKLVGTGGTTTILARMENALDTYNRNIIESTILSRKNVEAQVERLWSMPLRDREKLVGLPPKRADVILRGVAIYEAIMEHFDFSKLHVSTRGLRYAAVLPPGTST